MFDIAATADLIEVKWGPSCGALPQIVDGPSSDACRSLRVI
jgi:hypothetical protein